MTKVKKTRTQYLSIQQRYHDASLVQKARVTNKIVVDTGTKEEKVLKTCVTRYTKEKSVLMSMTYNRYGRYQNHMVIYDSRQVLEEVVRMTGLQYEIMELDEFDDVW